MQTNPIVFFFFYLLKTKTRKVEIETHHMKRKKDPFIFIQMKIAFSVHENLNTTSSTRVIIFFQVAIKRRHIACTSLSFFFSSSSPSSSPIRTYYGVFFFFTYRMLVSEQLFNFFGFGVLLHCYHQHLNFADFGHCIDYPKNHPKMVHCKKKTNHYFFLIGIHV